MSAQPKRLSFSGNVKIWDKIFFSAAFLFAFFFMSHPDLWETANHSYVFLESVFSGNFMDFYEICAAHDNTYYYINGANYNIIVYVLFGLWELPVFIVNHLLGLAMNEVFLIYWAKCVSVGFFIGCGYMVKIWGRELGLKESEAFAAALFFLFNPIAFYSPMVMGQYDTLCLFFTLWALRYYTKGDLYRFSFIIGAGVVFKFFSLLIFVPLILLAEKRLLRILRYGAICLWLYLPTTLLFWGKTGSAASFTQAMIDRLFALTYETGIRGVSVFTLGYALVVFLCFLWAPKTQRQKAYLSVYVPLAVFGLLFNGIVWHPQWVVLLIPFMILTTFMQSSRHPWFYLDVILSVGFFMHCFYQLPNQTGAVLFDGGLLRHIFGHHVAGSPTWRLLSDFLAQIPYIWVLTPVMFTGAIVSNIIFKFPMDTGSLADRLSNGARFDAIPVKVCGYGIFLVGFVGAWLLPSVLEAFVAFGVL